MLPPDLMERVELERTAADLSRDLIAARGAEEALRGQLAPLQLLPEQLQRLMERVGCVAPRFFPLEVTPAPRGDGRLR